MNEPPTQHDMTDLKAKLDNLIAQSNDFDARERKVLHDMTAAWESAAGFIKVTKTVGLVLAFIVVFITQKDRLMDFLRGVP